MSTENHPLISESTGLIAKGKRNMPTETTVELSEQRGTITLSQTARKPAAHDLTVTSKLSLDEARALRDELTTQIAAAGDGRD
jgi:hypothetical protein